METVRCGTIVGNCHSEALRRLLSFFDTGNQGRSNAHGRPHAITISDSKESVVEGLRFVQSQMWTMTVARSERLLLQDIYVNSTSGPGRDFRSIVNTDGVDVSFHSKIW